MYFSILNRKKMNVCSSFYWGKHVILCVYNLCLELLMRIFYVVIGGRVFPYVFND